MNPASPTRKSLNTDHSTLAPSKINPKSSPPPVQQPMKQPPIPYNPQRVSQARDVLIPLTQADMWAFSNPSNSLRRAMALRGSSQNEQDDGSYSPSQPQAASSRPYPPPRTHSQNQMDLDHTRKRKRDEEEHPVHRSPRRPRDTDNMMVAHHYNARPEVGRHARRESPIFGLKAFNNWVKSVLIQKMTPEPLSKSPWRAKTPRSTILSGRVLDIGCGKGGDLQKWQKARIKEYVALDVASVSVNQARERWRDLKGDTFEATFAQLDCYTFPISREIPGPKLEALFDVVTMQFCMHYAFETEDKVRTMLDNVSRYLRVGGRFVGTIPNSDILFSSLSEARETDPDTLTFGNSVYRIRFDDIRGPLYGHRYMFYLQDAVEDVPEYVVYWDKFVSLTKEYGLSLVYKKEFHEIFQEEQGDPEFSTLLKKMKVVDDRNESAMDEDQWDAANIYLAFAFEKTSNDVTR
ncbi:guanine-N(7)-methyltransferase [Serendipita vermifera]|nr:guanine-N(7)-methyltransferase [Serendipita vermifera]